MGSSQGYFAVDIGAGFDQRAISAKTGGFVVGLECCKSKGYGDHKSTKEQRRAL